MGDRRPLLVGTVIPAATPAEALPDANSVVKSEREWLCAPERDLGRRGKAISGPTAAESGERSEDASSP